MRLQDALFNWLQIHIVATAREEDGAAVETREFFETILREDHQMTEFGISSIDEEDYIVTYTVNGDTQTIRFDRDNADRLLADINGNPRYNEMGC